ncbi:unnamed protein product [Spirodela intermedia]|uniref:Uncharacterized protein n=1 Tax=Spirodela intermedia TaxID=51605 RepID=A0A7I8LGC7_SPIIN|nr:unnamed protein product [Spirodela intermedia]
MCSLIITTGSNVREDCRAVSTASKALLGQRRCGGTGWRWGVWSFILRSTQQEEALHHIWYAVRRPPNKLLFRGRIDHD